jgi:protein-S-isoprenylcysteine O-methyltransferase Ste14
MQQCPRDHVSVSARILSKRGAAAWDAPKPLVSSVSHVPDHDTSWVTVLSLVGYSFLLTVAFGVRTVLHRRRTGATGWLTPPTPAAWVGDGLFTLGVVAIVAAPALDAFGTTKALRALNRLPIQLVGATLFAGGATIALVAQAQMGAAWRAGIEVSQHHELVRRGLFSLVRNPFYLGMVTASFGVAVMVPNIASLIGWVVLAVGCEIDVRLVEEPHLRAAHGEVFTAYQRSTPRFVPGLPSLRHR